MKTLSITSQCLTAVKQKSFLHQCGEYNFVKNDFNHGSGNTYETYADGVTLVKWNADFAYGCVNFCTHLGIGSDIVAN